MVLPKKAFGRLCSSRYGTCPVETNCSSVPVITAGMGGQPDTLMMGLSPTMADTGQASVGLGSAKGIPPKAEQVPTQTMAVAPLAASRKVSTALRPPAVQ